MALTKEQWLARPGLFRCMLVEIDYIEAGTLKTLYLSNHAFVSKPSDTIPNQPYKTWLNSRAALTFSQRMAVALYGETQTGTSAIELFLHPSIEHLIINGDFSGQKLKVLIGDADWPRDEFIEKFQGYANSFDPVDDKRARITFSDVSKTLEQGVLKTLVTTGPSKDNFIPKLFGCCFNVEPLLINEVTRTYQVNDGAIQAITQVRESGFVIPPTNYTVDLANGKVSINTNVTGRITLDAEGHVENGIYLSTAEAIINHLLISAGQSASINSNVLPTYELGLYVRSQRDVDTVFDEICRSVGGNWFYNELGQFRLQHYTGLTTSTGFVKPSQIKKSSMRVKTRLPAWKKLTLGYQQNYTVQTDGLAYAITENNPELTALYGKEYSVVSDENAVSNNTSAIEVLINTLIVNKVDADIELEGLLAMHTQPQTIFECETILKKTNQGETVNLKYSRFFSAGQDVVVVGQVHKLNRPTDMLEVLA